MAVRIRLTRMGAKKKPVYRLVVTENLRPRDSKFIDFLGYYDPGKEDAIQNVKEDRILHWLDNGAKPTDTVRDLLRKAGIMAKWNESRKSRLSNQSAEGDQD